MAESIRELASLKDVDPRGRVLVAGGGAAGGFVIPVADALGVRALVVPRTAAVMTAFGGSIADVVREFNRAHLMSTAAFDHVGAQRLLDELADKAHSFLDEFGIPRDERTLEYSVEARYPLQERDLNVALRSASLRSAEALGLLAGDFHAIHRQVRGSNEPDQDVEFVLWTVRATGALPRVESALRLSRDGGTLAEVASEAPSPASSRPAFFVDRGTLETPVFDGDSLAAGQIVRGPCIVSEPLTSLVVPPGFQVRCGLADCYVVDFSAGHTGSGVS
jgi:N-methylhydantoinase A